MFGFGFNILKRKGGINLILPAEEYIEEGSIVDVTEINAVNTWFKTICGDNTDQQALCDNPYSIDFLYKFRVLNLSSPTSLDACRINAANVGGVWVISLMVEAFHILQLVLIGAVIHI